MNRYYRVKKDTFMWGEGAILEFQQHLGSKGGYKAISDIWDTCKLEGEYISSQIIEQNPDFFERVYKVDLLTKVVYETKEKAKKLIDKAFKA